MRNVLLSAVLIVNLLPFGVGYAGSFVITQGVWETQGDSIMTGFVAEGLVGTASGLGFGTPLSGDILQAGNTVSLNSLLVSEAGSFTVQGATFPVNAASPSAYALQVTGGPITLPTSFSSSLTIEAPALLAGTLWLCADSINPCGNHTVTGSGLATLNFTGTSFAGLSPTYQLNNLYVAFSSLSEAPQNAVADAFAGSSNQVGVISNPEPTSLLLLGSGLVGLGIWRKTRRRGNIHN